uniref:Ionotropic receptor 17 n=1 Tax=Holotrichia parallela TaxID=93412 RepID=A0A2P9JY99_HOLPA|nr:ionotropic receptor 17 [Holotrichia parallela]
MCVLITFRLGHPYLMYKNPTDGNEVSQGNDAFEGYSIDVIDNIAKIANFSYTFFITENNELGSYNKEKKAWNGLIRDILNRKAHLGICDLTITEERRSAVDFSLPFMTLGISILYSKPKPEERDIFAFMNPLDPVLWLYISVAYITITFVMYFLTRISPGDWENPNPSDTNPEELENIWDLKNSFWLILGSTMSQSCDLLPKGVCSRMGISMWWLLILIISNSYIANLSAFLTTSRMGPTIDNAESLAKQTKIKYGAIRGGSTEAFFRNSNFSTYQRMWTQMVQAKPTSSVKDNAEGVKRVKTTKNQLYAFLMESSSIEYETAGDCDLKQVGGRLDYKGYGIAMPVNAPYRGAINNAILRMQEDGTLSKLKIKWWKEMRGGDLCKGDTDSSSSDMKLALGNIGGVFVVVFFGVGFACLIAIGEFLWNVYTVSVEEHRLFKEILINELVFFVSVWHTKKKTYHTES